VASWRDGDLPVASDFLSLIESLGKGRLAHRLVDARLDAPAYVEQALQYLAGEDDSTGEGT
jgi:hypothetical protein